MEPINLLYIDDDIDPILNKYLKDKYRHSKYSIHFHEREFNPAQGYESLLEDEQIREANVILIDSRLFENQTAVNGKFSGEEFKVVLKKLYPFIEVIVITQNGSDDELQIVGKYNPSCGKSAMEYYADTLSEKINHAVDNVAQYRILANKEEENANWDPVLKEKVLGAVNGADAYDELKKADIDKLISAFQQIQEKLDG